MRRGSWPRRGRASCTARPCFDLRGREVVARPMCAHAGARSGVRSQAPTANCSPYGYALPTRSANSLRLEPGSVLRRLDCVAMFIALLLCVAISQDKPTVVFVEHDDSRITASCTVDT